MLRQHPHQPRPTRNLLGRRPLAGHPGQLGLLGRRCEDTVPLYEPCATVPKRSRKVQHFVYSYFELRTLVVGRPRVFLDT